MAMVVSVIENIIAHRFLRLLENVATEIFMNRVSADFTRIPCCILPRNDRYLEYNGRNKRRDGAILSPAVMRGVKTGNSGFFHHSGKQLYV